MTNNELVDLFAVGFAPALTLAAVGVQFSKHYLRHVNECLDSLENEIKQVIRIQFIEPLEDRKPGIRTVDRAELPLKYIRIWGRYAYHRQYYKFAVWKCALFSVGGALCWVIAFVLDHLFLPSKTVSATVHSYSLVLEVATIQSSLRKASIVLGLLFAFFAFVVLLRFELGDDETNLRHPRE